MRDKREQTRYLQWLIRGGLILLLLGLGWKSWRVGQAAYNLLNARTQAEQLLADGPAAADPDELELFVLAAHRDIRILHNELRFMLPLGRAFGWAPRVGPLLAAAPELMAMADAGLEAAAYGVRAMKPALLLMQEPLPEGESRLPGVTRVMADGRADLIAASRALDRAVAARQQLGPTDDFPWRVRTLLAQADAALPGAQVALKLAPHLPAMLGHAGPRAYLILAQNEDELRATGGFISGAGLMVVENGRILALEFMDANFVDDWRNKPYDFPPEPLYTFMSSELFLFRDANYWPDFPTSAVAALDLYSYGRNLPPLDGAIALDQAFLTQLLAATGPVYVPELGQTVRSGNVIAAMREAWSHDEEEQTTGQWIGERKSFMGPLVVALRDQIEREPTALDMRETLNLLTSGVEGKHLQVYMRDPVVAAVLRQIGLDGHLPLATDVDMLALVDTNMGFNKVNPVVSTRIAHTVNLSGDGRHTAETRIRYDHQGQPSAEPCAPGTPYFGGMRYETMINDCLWNYQRLYVAPGSRLTAASEHPVPGEMLLLGVDWPGTAVVGEENGHTLFSNFFILQAQTALESFYRYELPAYVVQSDGRDQRYAITIFRQAGTAAIPMTLTLNLPAGARLVSLDADRGTADDNNPLQLTAVLDANWTVSVVYRLR